MSISYPSLIVRLNCVSEFTGASRSFRVIFRWPGLSKRLDSRGVHPSEAIFHLFQIFPLFSKKNSDSAENFQNFTFPEKFLDFHPTKFLMTDFLFIDHKFRIPPYFPCFSTFPLFRKNYNFPLLLKMSPLCFRKIHMLFAYFISLYVYFVSPYFDHDAFMHHPMHALQDRTGVD